MCVKMSELKLQFVSSPFVNTMLVACVMEIEIISPPRFFAYFFLLFFSSWPNFGKAIIMGWMHSNMAWLACTLKNPGQSFFFYKDTFPKYFSTLIRDVHFSNRLGT